MSVECEQGSGGGDKGSPPLEMGQDEEKPLQEPDSVQTTILTPTPSKHSPGGTEKRFKPRSQGRPVISSCHPFCGSAQAQAQGKVKGTGEEERSKHPLRAQATPSTLAQQGESGLNPKWVGLFRFSNYCVPPPDVSSSSHVLPDSLTPPPHPRLCPRKTNRLPALPCSR